jgi:hypothetical protein
MLRFFKKPSPKKVGFFKKLARDVFGTLFAFALLGFALIHAASWFEIESPDTHSFRPEKRYVSTNVSRCENTFFECPEGEEFFKDTAGCGCVKKEVAKNLCAPEEKQAEACIEIYSPVCGWYDPKKVQCVKYPCALEFSNKCFACKAKDVLYWTDGSCPE